MSLPTPQVPVNYKIILVQEEDNSLEPKQEKVDKNTSDFFFEFLGISFIVLGCLRAYHGFHQYRNIILLGLILVMGAQAFKFFQKKASDQVEHPR